MRSLLLAWTFVAARADTCDNTCGYAYDGDCDDGQPGSDYSICACGTDCSDCGSRASCDTSGTNDWGTGNGWCSSDLDDHVGDTSTASACWTMCENTYADLVAIDWTPDGEVLVPEPLSVHGGRGRRRYPPHHVERRRIAPQHVRLRVPGGRGGFRKLPQQARIAGTNGLGDDVRCMVWAIVDATIRGGNACDDAWRPGVAIDSTAITGSGGRAIRRCESFLDTWAAASNLS